MTMTAEKIYTTMSSAKRGAMRAKIVNPVFTKREDGRIVVSEALVKEIVKKARTPRENSTMTIIKAILAETGMKRSQVIAAAVAKGIPLNTARSYYQKIYKN
jgi:hypothetical protein